MRFGDLSDGDLFVRPDTVTPGAIYRRRDARNYVDPDGWRFGRWADEPPITCKVERVTVTTWADGYGLWHARIVGPDILDFRPSSMEQARLAILAELREREGGRISGYDLRVTLEALDLLPDGRVAIQYGEAGAWPDRLRRH